MNHANTLKTALLLAALLPLVACNPFSDDAADSQGAKEASGHDTHTEQENSHSENSSQRESEKVAHEDDEHAGEANAGEGERRIHLTPIQRERLDVRVAKAESGSASAEVQAPATVAFVADNVARVGPRLEAKVVEISKDLGDTVKAGETLAVLDSVELGRAKSRYLVAQARFNAALAEYQRDKKLAEQQITSEAHFLEAKAAYLQGRAERDSSRAELRLYGVDDSDIKNMSANSRQPLSRYRLIAPIDGQIQRRDLVPGQTVSPQDTPVHIVNSTQMWVFIEAYEQDLPSLATGLPVKLSVRALPGETFAGTTNWVSSELDEKARTVRVRATVPNPDGKLRAGMFGSARIQVSNAQNYALVPVDAVQTLNGEDVVFVPAEEDNAFDAVAVTTGNEAGGQVEIRQGLMPGNAVVVVGAFDLNSALTAGSRSAAHNH